MTRIEVRHGVPVLVVDRSPRHFVFYGTSGHGKSVTSEAVVEELHNDGSLVIVITEKFKHRLEYAHCQFLPVYKLHLDFLKKWGILPGKKDAIVHALSVNNTKYVEDDDPFKAYWKKKLPPLSLFTIDVKNDITIKLWKILFNTKNENESIIAVVSCQKELSDSEGVLDLARMCEEKIRAKKLKGTQQNIDEINSVMEELFGLGFVQPANCKMNYNPDELLFDQKNYHIFYYGFLPGESYRKYEYFAVNCVMQKTINRYGQLKSIPAKSEKLFPIVWVIQEANIFLPNKPNDNYVIISTEIMEESIKQLRSTNQSSVADAQNMYRTSEGYGESVTDEYRGRLSKLDVERISKTAGYSQAQRNRLLNMPKNHYWKGNKNDRNIEKVFRFPSHQHCEPGKDYFVVFAKNYPERLKNHKEEHEYLENVIKIQQDRYDQFEKEKKQKKKTKTMKKEMKKIEKLEKSEEEKQELIEKLKQSEEEKDKELYRKIYLESKLNPDQQKPKSWVQLGKDNGISDKTAKDYADRGRDS